MLLKHPQLQFLIQETRQLGGALTSRSFTANVHWCGGQFVAPKTDTITGFVIRTTTNTSPVMEIEVAITQLDASGYPLGSDLGVTNSQANPASSTDYLLTFGTAVSVTAGTTYGVICRVKSGTYVSGTTQIRHSGAADLWGGYSYPTSSYNTGSNSKVAGMCHFVPIYSTGYEYTLGLGPYHWIANGSEIFSNNGRIKGNKFSVHDTTKIYGYIVVCEFDYDAEVALYSETATTSITGSTISLLTAARGGSFGVNPAFLILPSPITLSPNINYRLGYKNINGNSISLYYYDGQDDYQKQILGIKYFKSIHFTDYTGGSWVDDTSKFAMTLPLISEFNGVHHRPTFSIGL